jgi:cobyrinic acid a,c-diamide synthase
MPFSVPRLVIAAPSSGSGKTTVATGLMAAFSERGLSVSPHKVGPDYIDPGYHALAVSGGGGARPGRNLDAYMCGPELMAPLFAHGASGCDLAVVEGVMGLYDGAADQGELASTAHVAKLLRAPVVLVVDASSQSRSVAALVHGFVSWDPEVRVGGVILNKVASDRHERLLRDALEGCGVPVLGALRRTGGVDTPSRHLGLVPVAERRADAVESTRALAKHVRAGCDLEALLALARTAPALEAEAWDPEAAVGAVQESGAPLGRPVVAVAGGSAFTFSYAEQTELLAAAGAEVVVFDPLRDEGLPAGTRGLVIGGGFPEVYAPELSANEELRRAVAALAHSGAPVAAECAGLLYLARSLDGRQMCGVLDADARMTERLTLGYRAGTSSTGPCWSRAPGPIRHGAWCALSGAWRASYAGGCTPAICIRTGRPRRASRAASWSGAGRRERDEAAGARRPVSRPRRPPAR